MKTTLYFSGCLFLYISCTSPLQRQISKDTLTQDVQEIITETPKLDATKKSFLDFLLSEKGGELAEELENQHISYKYVFKQLDSIKSIKQKYLVQINRLSTRIDSVCLVKETKLKTMNHSKEIIINPIGIIHTPHKEINNMPIQPIVADGIKGTIEIFPEYVKGLSDLDGFSHIILLYHFHKIHHYDLMVKPFMDNKKI